MQSSDPRRAQELFRQGIDPADETNKDPIANSTLVNLVEGMITSERAKQEQIKEWREQSQTRQQKIKVWQ